MLGGSTGAPNAPQKNTRENSGMRGLILRPSIPFNLFGASWQLPGAVPLDAELRRKIFDAEIGTRFAEVAR